MKIILFNNYLLSLIIMNNLTNNKEYPYKKTNNILEMIKYC